MWCYNVEEKVGGDEVSKVGGEMMTSSYHKRKKSDTWSQKIPLTLLLILQLPARPHTKTGIREVDRNPTPKIRSLLITQLVTN